ncbi:uncharacterized protein LOC115227337 [Octopus sinensis]|uniref:Uncharacterized protein LOC115227337 n=1 Tax=Octopus sinensis TaxID=2607531 RepID=A0A6P7TQN4_9MOLL|nr:uncharacterized protein LOC115227337 [Octopus sinensis]
MWLDSTKAFDSVPRSWMLQTLQLAKVPVRIIKAIQYRRGISQEDSLSVMLFILSVNSLSFILRKFERYLTGSQGNRNTKIIYCFYVDDLKLCTKNMHEMKKSFDLVKTFSKDVLLEFGLYKYYMIVNTGRTINQTSNISINDLTAFPGSDEECYRYLGVAENVSYSFTCNKTRVSKEFYSGIKKMWSSELSTFNKTVAHNVFIVPVLIPKFGLLDSILDEILQLPSRSLSDNPEYMPKEVSRLYRNVSSDERISLYEQNSLHGYRISSKYLMHKRDSDAA